MLRNDQVSDMIGDMLGDTNIDLLFDFDFADLIDDCDEDSVSHANTSYEGVIHTFGLS
jgi:hypothetical protein